jgi:uncharacterized membrane protein
MNKEIEEGKTLATLSYISVIGLIVLLTEKKNKFVQFHAKQGTAVFAIEVILYVIISLPFGWTIAWITWLPYLISVYGIVLALQGTETKIPVINDIGEKIAGLIKPKK